MDPSKESPDSAGTLTLPWNRKPNYLICVVALANLVGGVVALVVAFGFWRDAVAFDGYVATLFTALFGLLWIWVAWQFRTGVLPVSFVADAGRRECGFRWQRWWNGRFDLAEVEFLIGELRPRHHKWQWAILIPPTASNPAEKWIYGSAISRDSEQEAEQECRDVLDQLSRHFDLPGAAEIRSA